MLNKLLILLFIIFTYSSADNKKVSIQFMWHDQFEFAGFYIAKEMGFYNDFALDVTFNPYTIDTNVTQNVLNGNSDFGTGSSSLLVDKAKGKEILLIGAIFQSSPLVLLGLKNSNIKTIKDIENKRIMLTSGEQRSSTFNTMLKSQGVDIKTIKAMKHSFDIEDLISNKTDLMLAYTTNEPYLLKERGYEALIFNPKDYGFDFYEEFIFTSKSFAKQHPNLVINFYTASIKGWEYAFNNIEETAKLIFEKYNSQNKSLKSLIFEGQEMKKLAFTKNGEIGVIKKDKLELTAQTYRVMGLIKGQIDIDDTVFKLPIKNDLSNKENEYLRKKKEITMCIDPDWLPFEKLEKGRHVGMSADYFKLLEKELNIEIKVIPTKTWAESLIVGKKRGCDIFSLVMKTPERLKYLNFTKPYLITPLVIATNNNAQFISNLSQVKKKKIGMVKGYAYAEILQAENPDMNFIDVKNLTEGLNRVETGELFGFIGALATVGYQIQNNYLGQLKIAGKFDEKFNLAIGTRIDEPMLNSIFNKAISKISIEEHQNILNKWISINYQQGVQYQTMWKYFSVIVITLLILVLVYRQYLLRDLNKKLNTKVKIEIEKNIKQNEMLAQQTKMAAMGEMIGNIAHQWRQPLSTISTAATGLKLHYELNQLKPELMVKSLDAINNSAQYLSTTIDDFRNFFNADKEQVLLDIKDIFTKSLNIVSAQYKNQNIEVIESIEPIETIAYKNELIQAVINILNNAKDALLNVKHKRIIFIKTFKKDGNIIIVIKDNAGGIPADILSRIFEPYFTTKHKSQGTGIGLYMTEEIIVKHLKGKIEATNEKFEYKNTKYTGAKLKITLPINLVTSDYQI